MIWCDIMEVRLGLSCFVFGVILVSFGVICKFFVLMAVLLCALGVIWL